MFFSIGLTKKPVAKFPFDNAFGLTNIVRPSHTAFVNQVDYNSGLHGGLYGSLELKGIPDSYIIIPNRSKYFLDTRFSMTILMYVYPMNRRGPILCFYHQKSGFIGIQIAQTGVQDGKGVITVSFNR